MNVHVSPPSTQRSPRFLKVLISVASVISVVSVVGLVGAQAPASADAWSQFRGNARLTGIAAIAPPAVPAVRWTYEAGEAIDASPAIAAGRIVIGTQDGRVYCFG